VYFCDAHAPWQRGSNENMNGLLRDYFPKGTDLAVHGLEELAQIAADVNQRPRKTLALRVLANTIGETLSREGSRSVRASVLEGTLRPPRLPVLREAFRRAGTVKR